MKMQNSVKLDNIEYKIPNYLVFKDVKKSNLKDIYYGLNFSRKLIENKFAWAAANKTRIVAEWKKRYDGKTEPKKK